MSEDEDDDQPTVNLGTHTPVEGAPLARISSRLTWPKELSEVNRLEGDSVIRTSDGPQGLSSILEEVDTTYFERRQEFESVIRDVIGTDPVQTNE